MLTHTQVGARKKSLRVPLALAAGLGMMLVTATPASAASETIYDSMSSPFPSNYSSLSNQAQQTAEFGDHVTLGRN